MAKLGRCYEFEVGGGGSMHWRVGVNTVKTLTFEKRWGVHDPYSSYGGAAPDDDLPLDQLMMLV